jgi:hypothetical protein
LNVFDSLGVNRTSCRCGVSPSDDLRPTGGDNIFTRRTLLEVGEAGPERVRVDKLGGSYGHAGVGSTTINIQAPIYTTGLTHNRLMQDLVKEAERENFRRRGRRLA